MADAPILTAEELLTDAIRDALVSAVGTYNGRPKAYYQIAEQGAPLPYIVFQFQTDISRMDWIGRTGATAQLTLKAVASSTKVAQDLRATAAPYLASLTAGGYTVTARYLRSPAVPPSPAGVYQALHVYRLRIEAT